MGVPSVMPISALRTNPITRLTRLPAAMIALWPAVPAAGSSRSPTAAAPGSWVSTEITGTSSGVGGSPSRAACALRYRPPAGFGGTDTAVTIEGAVPATGAAGWYRYAGRPMSVLNSAQKNAVAELLRVSPVADELGRRFAAAGHELHLVGGSVRDALLGHLGDDLDFCTDGRPEQTLELIKGWAEAVWTTGQEFGTIGLARGG